MKNEALVHAKELHSVLKGNRATDYIYQHSLTQVKNLTREIKDVEKEIMDLINSEEEIKNNYERITSIKGVAFVNALALIVYTENFTCLTIHASWPAMREWSRSNEPPDPVSKVTQRPVDLPIKN